MHASCHILHAGLPRARRRSSILQKFPEMVTHEFCDCTRRGVFQDRPSFQLKLHPTASHWSSMSHIARLDTMMQKEPSVVDYKFMRKVNDCIRASRNLLSASHHRLVGYSLPTSKSSLFAQYKRLDVAHIHLVTFKPTSRTFHQHTKTIMAVRASFENSNEFVVPTQLPL